MNWLRGIALVLAFAVAATFMFPLRMAWAAATAPSDIAVGAIDGTIWSGRLTHVSWRGVALGDFDASLSPLDLLPVPALQLANGSGPLKSATLRGGGDAIHISDAEVIMGLAGAVPGAPADLTARISGGALRMAGGRCTEASGRIESAAAPSIGLPEFNGTLACDRGALLARLDSQAGQVVLELGPSLERVTYRSASPGLALALDAAGIAAASPG